MTIGEGAQAPFLIVGHGRSAWGQGELIDTYKTCRLKNHPYDEQRSLGQRTDIICTTNKNFEEKGIDFWWFGDEVRERWIRYYKTFNPKKRTSTAIKPSTCVAAIFCAVDHGYSKIHIIGFDYVMNPGSERQGWPHDCAAENRAIFALDMEIIVIE